MIKKEILVEVYDEETKVAVLEDDQLVEIYVERAPNPRLGGNIYKGIIKNVLPGMQAAFIDIGLERNAFLYVQDAIAQMEEHDEEEHFKEKIPLNIMDVVKEGQELVVQVAKEPVGTKGARVTTRLTLPGRYLVLIPNVEYIGISRRIENEEERERLKKVTQEIKPPNTGVIIRTVAEGASAEELKQDIDHLLKIYQRIIERAEKLAAPSVIHKDLELIQRILRDVFSEDTQKLYVNSRMVLERVLEYLDITDPSLKGRVFLQHTGNLFAEHAIDYELTQALKRKVWLKSGGYLIIDQVEALTAIDVNTGKFVGKTNLADTVLKTNVEAAKEIARQLRLRNIGGIVIVDFIDMHNPEHQQQVLKVLENEIKRDRVKVHILGITPLGLVEMTRKKIRQSLSSTLERVCPCCEGKGKVLSEETIYYSLIADLKAMTERTAASRFIVYVNPHMAGYVSETERLEYLHNSVGVPVSLKTKDGFELDKYEIQPVYQDQSEEEVSL